LKLSIILLVQFLKSIPRPIRFQVTDITFFKHSNNLDLKIIQEEFVNLENDKFNDLTRYVFINNHDFLFINKNNETYFKNLQKINL
jgi:hypothetical protein